MKPREIGACAQRNDEPRPPLGSRLQRPAPGAAINRSSTSPLAPQPEPALREVIDIRSNYVHAHCTGQVQVDHFVSAVGRALESARSTGLKAILMDVREVTGTLSTVDRFVLGEDIAAMQRTHAFAAAVAVLGKEPLVEADRLGEKVATNRGAIGKVFTDLEEAERWIEEYLSMGSSSGSGAFQ